MCRLHQTGLKSERMKIVFLFPHTSSGSLGSVVRVRELMKRLKRLGVNVTLCSPFVKSKFAWEDIPVYHLSSFISNLGMQDIAYGLLKHMYYRKSFIRNFTLRKSFIKRQKSYFSKKIKKLLTDVQPDILQVEDHVMLNYMPDVSHAKIVVDLHNLTSEELVSAGVIEKNGEEFQALQKLTKESLAAVHHVIVVSEAMETYVKETYDVPGKDITIVPPGGRPRLTHRAKRTFPPKVCYAGEVSYREHVDLYVKSAAYVLRQRPDVSFYITNKGEQLRKIKGEAKKLGVKPIYYWYPGEEFYNFIATCHIGALPSKGDQARKIGTPVKLFDYMSLGLPVVANYIGAWTEIIKSAQTGLLTEDDPKDFASAIVELINDSELWTKCSLNGIRLVNSQYNWDRSSAILADLYKRL